MFIRLIALVLAVAFMWRAAGTPAVIVAAAIAPAAFYAVLIALAARGARAHVSLLIATFFWGAVFAAWLATTLNAAVTGPLHPRSFDPVLAVPAIEELAKGTALVIAMIAAPRALRGVRDCIVGGAMVGLGFAASENVLYLTLAALQGGYPGLFQAMYLRSLLYGLNHAVFTATTGAALGYARDAASRPRAAIMALVGWCAAVVQHLAWNATAATRIVEILCDPAAVGEACRVPPSPWHLYVVAPAIVTLFVGPGAVVLLALARRRESMAWATRCR